VVESLKGSLEQKSQENLAIRAQYDQLATSYNQNQSNQVSTPRTREYCRYLCIYAIYGPMRNVFDACRSITSGRSLDPGNREFFGPSEMASR
jgi:hypothetical protein